MSPSIDELEAFVRRGVNAQRAVDEVLAELDARPRACCYCRETLTIGPDGLLEDRDGIAACGPSPSARHSLAGVPTFTADELKATAEALRRRNA